MNRGRDIEDTARSTAHAEAANASYRAPARGMPGRELPADLVRLAELMDSSVRLPGGLRVGLDGLIGLVPGIGDAVGAGVSLYIVARAYRLGIPRRTLARMLLNVGAEALIGTVPLVGDLFDFAFKANLRNVALLRRRLEAPARGPRPRSGA